MGRRSGTVMTSCTRSYARATMSHWSRACTEIVLFPALGNKTPPQTGGGIGHVFFGAKSTVRGATPPSTSIHLVLDVLVCLSLPAATMYQCISGNNILWKYRREKIDHILLRVHMVWYVLLLVQPTMQPLVPYLPGYSPPNVPRIFFLLLGWGLWRHKPNHTQELSAPKRKPCDI